MTLYTGGQFRSDGLCQRVPGVFRGSGDISGDKYSGVSVAPCTAPCAALPPGSRDTK